MLRVRLFGRPRLTYGDIPLAAATRPKVMPLLAYLLLHRGEAVSRKVLAAALWPDQADDDARANLRRHLHYLGALLPRGDPPWVLASASDVRWNPAAPVELDVASFERLAGDPQRSAEAIALYEGDLLEDSDEPWVAPLRERYRRNAAEALTVRITALRAAGEHGAAISAARHLLAVDPWREDAIRALMRSRYESGDRAGALAEYAAFAQRVRAEIGVEPMPETTALHEAIAHETLSVFPAHATQPPAPGGLPSLPFVGRATELQLLAQCRHAAAAGNGALMLVGGEAGVGKTRLVREFAGAAEANGALVFAATTTFPEAIPYQPVADLLRAIAPLLRSVRIDPLWIAAAATIAPALLEYAPEALELPRVDGARERTRLFEACADVFEAVATLRPLVLVIEDLHAAGGATISLVEHLARRSLTSGLLIAATYREDDLALSHPLRAARRRLEHEGAALHLALGRLTREDVGALVRALGDGDAAATLERELYERSEGNAFFLGEILRDLIESRRVHLDARRWTLSSDDLASVPRAVRDAVRSRLARLDPRATPIAELAAIAGRTFDVELLQESTGWLEADVLDALGTLVDRRIVVQHGPGSARTYGFSHSLMQSVIYEDAPAAARVRRHRRIAHVMGALYADQQDEIAVAVAAHWERGNEPEAAAREYLRAARRAMSVFANEEADVHLQRALTLTGDRRMRFDALVHREEIAAAAGDRALQSELLGALEPLARVLDDEDAICTVLQRRIELADVTGERRRERILSRLLRRRAARSGAIRWQIRALESRARYLRGINDFEGARAAFEELIALTQRAGDRETLTAARLAYGDSYIYEGRLAEAHAVLRDLREVVATSGNRSALVRTLIAFARASLVQQDYATMSSFAEEAHEISRSIGDREGEALALHTLANGLVYTFNVAQAEANYARAREIYERIGHRVGIASISVDSGLFATELGLLDRALERYANARLVAEEIGFRWVACVEAVNRSYCLRLRGEAEAAKRAAESALAAAGELRSQPLTSAALGTLGAAESALGAYDDAIAHLEEGVALRRPAGATPRLGDNLCALTLAYLGRGDLEPAGRCADELTALYDANPKLAPQPTEWLWAAARAARARGVSAAADALLQRADSVMRARAAAIDDAETRAAYLALPFNRAVAEALAVGA